MIAFAELYDPFHSVWYRAVLALFLVVLTACLATRWRQFIRRSLEIPIPERLEQLEKRKLRVRIDLPPGRSRGENSGSGNRSSPAYGGMDGLMEETRRFFGKRGYSVAFERREGISLFGAVAGRWRFLGNFLFHAGILTITVGAVIGSFWGGSGFVYGRPGDRLPLPGSADSLIVEDFEILVGEQGAIRDYISTVTIVDGEGESLMTGEIEVNEPMRYKGLNIYQSSYFAAENEFESAQISLFKEGRVERLERGGSLELPERGLTIEPGRFIPDFRMGPEGPFSASLSMQNPALEIMVEGMGRVERGWLFLKHPRFNSKFDLPVEPTLVEIEPVYYTGMQVSYNPGEHVLFAGFLLGTVGLIPLYLLSHRVIGGALLKDHILIAGLQYRWKVGFKEEFDAMSDELTRILDRAAD